jgi:CHAD domain-containing protein
MPAKKLSTSRHVEVERKFDVTESTVSPSFAGIAAVSRIEKQPAQTLDAQYLDTPAQDLAAKRITLRRRAGGTDAGWHLKLPAGPDARTEVRAPLGDAVPDDLLDVVRAIVRDRPLRPVARITTTREVQLLSGDDGEVLAEFCDDHVTAWTGDPSAEQRWREWELELVGPDANTELLDRLSNRLLDAGATPSRHASKLARVLGDAGLQPDTQAMPADPLRRAVAEQVDQLLDWDRAVRADVDDAVHQMRVATRKIRSLLRASPDSFGVSDNTWVLDELRELAAVLGDARDAEVLAERYQQALDRLPPELVRGRVRERLVDDARDRYRAGRRRSLEVMRSPQYFRLLDALDALVAKPAATDAGREPEPTVASGYKRVRKAAKAAAKTPEEGRDAALHRIRKRAKRLRYTAAAVSASKVAQRAEAIQTLLGEHQDSVVSRMHLQQQADAASAAGEDTFTFGLLYQQEADLASSCRRQLPKALRRLAEAARKKLR